MEDQLYSIACKEVLEILYYTNSEDLDKIPEEVFLHLIENSSDTYFSDLFQNQSFSDLKLKDETIAILGTIYREYWCNDEEKLKFDSILNKNEEEYQKKLSEKYSYDKIFLRKDSNNTTKEKSNNLLPEESWITKEERWYNKIFNFISKIFKK